jgi:flagellar hook-associated protein 1
MSISSALNSAGTGLAAAARAIQVASGNVANAMTPGYAPRSVILGAANLGGQGAGVRVLGIDRQVDPVLQGLLRTAGAAAAVSGRQTTFWAAIETGLGLPDDPGGLNAALGALSSALVSAADRPDLDTRLAAVAQTANALVRHLGRIEGVVQDQRLAADTGIGQDVQSLNAGLDRLHRLNQDITRLQASGQSTLDLQDSRDTLVSELSQIVPLRTHIRPEGRMMVFTEGGSVLLDLQPATLGFTPVPGMTAGMTLAGGQLSGLTLNGRPVDPGPEGPLAGGRLSAGFALRDTDGPGVQSALDGLAASLIARFQAPGTDPSTPPGAPGLFTDAGVALGAPPLAPGLAGRLALNPVVDPAAGGALSRLRDGLGAAVPGPVGDPAQLRRWQDALDRPIAPAPGTAARSLAQELGETLAGIGQSRQQTEDRALYARSVHDALRQQVLDGGVDIDTEMRRLLAIETAYAANARVIQVADDMLRRLMEI